MNDYKDVWLILDSRNFGGIETHVYWLARALLKQNITTTVVFLDHYGEHPLSSNLKKNNIPFFSLDGRFSTLIKTIRDKQPWLLHSHGYKASIFCKFAGKLTNTPVVSTYHAGEHGRGKVRFYTWLDRHLAWLSTNIAVNAEVAKLVPANITTIPNFIELASDVEHIPNCKRIAFVGRLVIEKGPDLFCQLRPLLPADIQLEVFGDGPLLTELKEEYPEILFHGVCDDLSQVWPMIDLLCVPSRHEGLPLAALEAMSFGVPVAAFAVGGLPQLIIDKENGFIVPANQLEAMAEVIQEYWSMPNQDKIKLSNVARQTIKQRYTSSVVLPQILSSYRQACQAKEVSCGPL